MPLSPAICRRLAMAYPELRAHEWRVGDWYYSREHRTERPGVLVSVTPNEEGGYEIQDQVGDKPAPFELGEERDWVWCPRLDQLLDLVEKVQHKFGVGSEGLVEVRFSLDTHAQYFEAQARGIYVMGAKTREEAVASWLLTVTGRQLSAAKEAKDRADPPE